MRIAMKRQIGSLLCLVLSILFLHAAVPLLADEAFKIHVKQRGIANQEVGQVRVLLELAAAPAGATLKVAGQVLALDDPLKNIGGDLFRLTSATGNAVAVIYIPRSNFGADFCTGAGAVEKNVLVDFGPQDIVAYRIASYVVGAPSAECSKAF